MTCHHIIPQSKLKEFYLICDKYIQNNANDAQYWQASLPFWPVINKNFQDWKDNAEASAKASKDQRANWTPDDEGDLPFSACQWMSGNIFIGPCSKDRLDDPEDDFDYGGYREKPITSQKGWWLDREDWGDENKNDKPSADLDAKDAGNIRMDHLLGVYGKIKHIIKKNKANNCTRVLPNDMPLLLNTLTELADLAKYTGTLHLDPFSQIHDTNADLPTKKIPLIKYAYHRSDWVNVDKAEIKGMVNEHDNFVKIRNEYLKLLKSPNPTPFEKEFIHFFSKHFNSRACEDDHNPNLGKTVAKYTFNLIKNKYDILLASREKVKYHPQDKPEISEEEESGSKNRFHKIKKGINNSKKSGRLNKYIMSEIKRYDDFTYEMDEYDEDF